MPIDELRSLLKLFHRFKKAFYLNINTGVLEKEFQIHFGDIEKRIERRLEQEERLEMHRRATTFDEIQDKFDQRESAS